MQDVFLDIYIRRHSDLLCQKTWNFFLKKTILCFKPGDHLDFFASISSDTLCQKIVCSYMPDDNLVFYTRGPSDALWQNTFQPSKSEYLLVFYDKIFSRALCLNIARFSMNGNNLSSMPENYLLSYTRSPGDNFVFTFMSESFQTSISEDILLFYARKSSGLLCQEVVCSSMPEEREYGLLKQKVIWPFIVESNLAFYSRRSSGPEGYLVFCGKSSLCLLCQQVAAFSMTEYRLLFYSRRPPGLLCQGTFWISEEGDHLGFHQYSG